jgi:hypothetical protein
MDGHGARMWERKNACRILIGKTEEKKQLGRSRHVW